MLIKQNGTQENLEQIVLFPFDDYAIPFQRGVRLSLNSYGKSVDRMSNIVVGLGEKGAPDDSAVTAYGTIRRVGEELWMWYCAQSTQDETWNERVCFAKSGDGRNWEKPNLGLVEFAGNKNNNIVNLPVEGQTQACVVYYDPDDSDSARRFKMSFESTQYRQQMAAAFSPDGLNWTLHPDNPIGPWLEQAGGTKFNGVYYINGQGSGHWAAGNGARQLCTHISYDFNRWTQVSALGLRRDPLPPKPTEYGASNGPQVHLGAALWNRGNTLIGFYGMWNGHPSNDRRLTRMNLGMAVSHDGMHFREPVPDFPIVSAAEIGWRLLPHGDAVVHFPALIQAQGFENVGDETLFWYSPWPEGDADGVRLALWPRDRLGQFQAFAGPESESYVVSQPLSLEGKAAKVYLNADGVNKHTQLTVSVLTEQFEEIAGYEARNCQEMLESGFHIPVRWGNKDSVTAGGPVRIRVDFAGIRPEDAKLYALYLEH